MIWREEGRNKKIGTVLFTFTCSSCFPAYLPSQIEHMSLENIVNSSDIVLDVLGRVSGILHLSSGIPHDFRVFLKSFPKASEMAEIAVVFCVSSITHICILWRKWDNFIS